MFNQKCILCKHSVNASNLIGKNPTKTPQQTTKNPQKPTI